jgi:uncharacterized protein DUF3768
MLLDIQLPRRLYFCSLDAMSNEHSPEQGSRAAQIAHLNDAFRRSTQEVMVTQGVLALPDILGLVRSVRVFDTFTPDNDPYGEHDFGSINWYQEKTYWKIDYYDQDLQYWHDPLDPDRIVVWV